jgi:type I restriction enzyme, S subunit
MKSGWQIKTLGEVLQKTETVNPLQSPNVEFEYIDVSSVSNTTFEIEATQRLKGKDAPSRARKLVRTNDIIFATIRPTLQRIAVVPDHLDKQVCSTGYFVLRPKQGIDHRFVFYSLFTEDFIGQMESLQKGASYPAVTDGDVRAQEIPVPPLLEQQRIVGLLDEAFAAIAVAKANAEKNLQNARALFESHLQSVFTQRGKGWVEKRFDEICVLQRGFDLPTHLRNSGKYPLVSSNGITDRIDLWKIHGPGVVTGRSGTIGKLHFVDEDFWPLNTALFVKEFHGNNERFVYYFLKQFDLGKFSSGAGVPTLNRNNVHGKKVVFPNSLSEQKKIVSKLDALTAETQRLAAIYQRKLAALDALKKSLLYQAFNGEL